MLNRYIAAGFVVFLAIGLLMYTAVDSTAKTVVTVDTLVSSAQPRDGIRLGARVAEGEIEYVTEPRPTVRFLVHDAPSGEGRINVEYLGLMPDTLQVGRDVILEGKFVGDTFYASSLLTQCPSKYEVPLPGEEGAAEQTVQSYD